MMRSVTSAWMAAVLGFACLVAGCSSPGPVRGTAVLVESDPSKDFLRYRTYLFSPGQFAAQPGTSDMTPGEVERRMQAALQPRLAGKGLTPAKDSNPDLIVTYRATIRRQQVIVEGASVRNPNGYDEAGAIRPGAEWGVQAYEEGSVILQFTDARTHEMVWQATLRADVDAGTRKLATALDSAMKDYPPRKK